MAHIFNFFKSQFSPNLRMFALKVKGEKNELFDVRVENKEIK